MTYLDAVDIYYWYLVQKVIYDWQPLEIQNNLQEFNVEIQKQIPKSWKKSTSICSQMSS